MTNGQFQLDLSELSSKAHSDVESWIVNTVKIKLIKKFEAALETPGRSNLRELLLVPLFTVKELTGRVKEFAPELLTVYFKELFAAVDEGFTQISG